MEKVEETLEMDIFGLVEAPLHEESVFGYTQEKKIPVLHGFEDLTVKFFNILFEEVVAARIQPPCLNGDHEGGYQILHAARQGVIGFALISAHPYPEGGECGK